MIHRLRSADSSDFEPLWALWRANARDRAARAGEPWAEAEQRAGFTQRFAGEPLQIVEVDGELAGMIAVRWDEAPAEVSVLELGLRWQGRGLGTRLLHDVLRRARQQEQAVALRIPPGGLAHGLVERLGMKPWPEGGVEGASYRWEASVRTDVTLAAAMAPWADPRRRRSWAHRLFQAGPDDAVGFVRFVAGRHGLAEPLTVLELDAGPGRHLRPLARHGARVLACGLDPEDRDAARQQAALAGPGVTMLEGGVEAIEVEGAVDLGLAVGGALWRLLEHDARVAALERLRRALCPGGVVLIEGPNMPWVLQANHEPAPRTEIYHRAAVSRICAQSVDLHDGVLTRRDTFVAEVDGEPPVEWEQTRRLALMGLPLLRVALQQAGLVVHDTYRDLRASGPTRIMGPRIVLVAGPRQESDGPRSR